MATRKSCIYWISQTNEASKKGECWIDDPSPIKKNPNAEKIIGISFLPRETFNATLFNSTSLTKATNDKPRKMLEMLMPQPNK